MLICRVLALCSVRINQDVISNEVLRYVVFSVYLHCVMLE